MTKEDVLNQFATDFSDPGAEKSGEYLQDHVLRRAERIVQTDRPGLVEAMRDWLQRRSLPHTLLAVAVARETTLTELVPDLHSLRDDIRDGRAFRSEQAAWVDEALAVLEP